MIKKILNIIKQLKDIKQIINSDNKNKYNKTIIFNTIKVDNIAFSIEFFIGGILAKYGAQVYYIIDDGAMKHWEILQYKDIKDKNPTILNPINRNFKWKLRYYLLYNFVKNIHPNIKVIKTSEILNQDIKIDDSIDYSNHIYSSMVRFFEVDNFEKKDYPLVKYKKIIEENAKNSLKIAKFIVDHIKPDVFMTSHGIYSTWGPIYDYMKKHNINSKAFRIHGYSNIDDILITYGNAVHVFTEKEKKEILSIDLKADIKEKVDNYMQSRFNFSKNDTKYLFDEVKDKDDKWIQLRKQADQNNSKIFIAFPNVVWDANLKENHRVFSGMIEWLQESIEYFKKSNDILIIRLHPSETTVMKGAYSVANEIQDLVDNKNVFLIPSKEKINSYWLINKIMDVGLIYTGFLGVEIPYIKKPVISVANTPYSNLDIFLEPFDKKEYFELLKDIDNKIDESFFENSYINSQKLLYYFIYKFRWQVPIISRNNKGQIDINTDKLNDYNLDISNNEVKKLIERILK